MTDTSTQHEPAKAMVTRAELVAGQKVAPIIPRTIDEVARIANAVIIAGLAPESFRGTGEKETASRIMIAIMKGAEIGLAPLTALANIAIINGKACLYGDGAVALIQASGKVEKWIERFEGEEGKDDFTAICEIWRRGQSEPYAGRFSLGDARRAKLLSKIVWLTFQSRMLMWRARTYAMRTGFADCLSGLSIAEEIQDFPPPPAPVDAAFLDDAPKTIDAGEIVHGPIPAESPDDTAEAPDPVRDELDGFIEALPAVRDMSGLRDLDKEVVHFLKEKDRTELLGFWNSAMLTRQKQLPK